MNRYLRLFCFACLCAWQPFAHAEANTSTKVCVAACTHAPVDQGEVIFQNRCAICHGKNADGVSDLARIMNPPPANLRASKLTDADQSQIVRKGGESVKRSPNMPNWEVELNESELLAVLSYVRSVNAPQVKAPPIK